MFLPSCANTIEKELKRLEDLEIMYSNCVIEGAKQKKALELIKKYISMNKAFKNLANKESCNLTLVEIKALIPDEEYELLKEVLK